MKRLTFAVVLLAFALLVVQTAAADDSYFIGMPGIGSLMKSPVVYSGDLEFALAGSWEITVDDSMWPDPADSTARFNYIWQTFFADNYLNMTGAESWTGYFDGATLMATPHFRFDTTSPVGVIEGDITFSILVFDWYADGILSQAEKHHDLNISATLNVDHTLGQGYFENACGHGSISSGFFNFHNPPMDDTIEFIGQLQTYTCPSPVEEITWGAVKALFE
ncbi:MAG: hypothetical protein KAW67_03895 [Candidatus Eisenbacteria sp.]|nr:hypothetical protein [Candidatus Eisenbacteria bacterium]